MGTPSQVENTMRRCWMMEPTSERIVQDIQKFEMVLDKIIAAEGCVVADEFLRTGRRGDILNGDPDWIKLKGVGVCKNKPVVRQRKSTIQSVIRPLHPDCQPAFDRLLGKSIILDPSVNLDNLVVHEHEVEEDDDNSTSSDVSDIDG
jgi:hypothetical protein